MATGGLGPGWTLGLLGEPTLRLVSQALAGLAEGHFSLLATPGGPRPRRRVHRAGCKESGEGPQQLDGHGTRLETGGGGRYREAGRTTVSFGSSLPTWIGGR